MSLKSRAKGSMGKCKLCGRDAGFLRREHTDCRLRYERGKSQIIVMTEQAILDSGDNHRLAKNVEREASRSHIRDEEVQDLLHKGWTNAANQLLKAGNLNDTLEDRLLAFPEYFTFPMSKGKRDTTLEQIHRARSVKLREAERSRKQALQMKWNSGRHQIKELIIRHGSRTRIDKSLALEIHQTATKANLTSRMRGNAVFAGWEEAVKATQPKASFGSNDRQNLMLLAKELNITQRRLTNSKALKAFDKELKIRQQDMGKQAIIDIIQQHGDSRLNDPSLTVHIDYLANEHGLNRQMRDEAAATGWEKVVNVTLSNSEFASNIYDYLVELAQQLRIPRIKVDDSAGMQALDKRQQDLGYQAIIDLIRSQGNAKIKDQSLNRRIHRIAKDHGLASRTPVALPFNLIKSEQLIWVFTDVEYLKEVVVRRQIQNKWGVSPTQYGMVTVDCGALGATSRHIYFVGDKERFRIRYDRIVSFKDYPNGFGLNRDAEKARHERFVTGEGWFTYNLVTTLAKQF